MAFWAIVPVKPLLKGKSRLGEVLTPQERADLNRRLLAHTLETLISLPEIEQVLVVSPDPAALALARAWGARTFQENSPPHLNVSLARATVIAQEYTTHGILILPADLPLLTPQDVRLILERGHHPPVVVIVPDHHHQGTNALLVSPPGLIEYEYGPQSFRKHCAQALEAGARLEICALPSLALDIDWPEDLEQLSLTLENP